MAATFIVSGFFAANALAVVNSIDVTAPNGGEFLRGSINIQWTAIGDPGELVDIYYSTNNFTTSTKLTASGVPFDATTFSWNTVAAGISDSSTYKIKVQSITNTGVQGTSADNFSIDNTPPVTTISDITPASPDISGWYNISTGAPVITLSCDDVAGSGCLPGGTHYSWDGGTTVETYTTPFTAPEGDKVLTYWSEDNAIDNTGAHNIESIHDPMEFKVDTQTPTISYTLNDNVADAFFNPDTDIVMVALTANEPVNWLSARIYNDSDSGIYKEKLPSGDGTNTTTFAWDGVGGWTSAGVLVDGIYKIKVHIKDMAGNEVTIDPLIPYTITVDTVGPTISDFDAPEEDAVYKPGDSIPITFIPSDLPGTTLECGYKVGAGEFVSLGACTEGDMFSGFVNEVNLVDGRNDILAAVKDLAGNEGVSPDPISIVFDNDGTLTVGPIVGLKADGESDFEEIQEAIDKATAGDMISVAAGDYTEQITINESLNLIGDGEATTTIIAPAVRDDSVTEDGKIHDYLLAAYAPVGTIDVQVEGFTFDVDSQNKTVGTDRIDGVFFRDVRDVGGSMAGLFASTIHNFAATPDYEAWGLAVYGDSLLTVNDNDISDYTRDGVVVIGGNITISSNIITGSATALNGINIQDVSTGSVTGNTVTGNTRSAPWAGGGIVLWASSGVSIEDNHVNGNFYGIDLEPDTNDVTVSRNELTNNIKRAISLNSADNNTVSDNTITGPVGGTDDVAIGLANTSTGNTIGGDTLEDGNTIIMATAGTGNLYAVYMQADVGVGENTIKYNTITGGKRAVQFDGPPGITGTTTVANNTISGQEFGGIVASNNGNLVITDNTLTNAVRPIEFFGPVNVTITGNIINGSTYAGINLGNFSGTADISDNTIHGIADNNGIWAQTSGAGLGITENTIYDISGSGGAGRGIQIDPTADNANIDGNEIYNVTGFAGIVIDTGATGAKINNNNIHNNEQGVVANEETAEFNNNHILNNRWGVDLNKAGAIFELLNNNISDNNTNPADSYGLNAWAGTASAAHNYWGAASGPLDEKVLPGTPNYNNPLGAGNSVSSNVIYSPWCMDEGCTTFGSSDPLDHYDVVPSVTSAIVSTPITLTITAKDSAGITRINDTSSVTMNADHGASLGALVVAIADGASGSNTTTVNNSVTGTVNVAAVQIGGTATGTTSVEFTNSDVAAPTIVSHSPLDNATGVAVTITPYIVFSEPLKASTVNSTNIQIKKYSDDSPVLATVSLVEGGTRINIDPDSSLENNTQYYFAVSTGVQDESGLSLASALDASTKDSNEFTTVEIQPIVVDEVVVQSNTATATDSYLAGWHYTFRITVNDGLTNLRVKFADWVNSADSSLKVLVNGNMRLLFNTSTGNGLGSIVGLTDDDIVNGIAPISSFAIGNEYTDQTPGVINIAGIDISTDPGRQIKFDVFTKLPVTTAPGFYETVYGIETQ